MCSNLGKGIVLFWFLLMSVPSNSKALIEKQSKSMPLAEALVNVSETPFKQVEETPINFTAQPEQCVTLRQGRKCFASVTLEWQAETEQNLCLHEYGHQKEIACWQGNKNAKVEFEFESNETVVYQLISNENQKIMAQTQIKVSWLHKKSSRKKRWRLF